MTKDQYVESIRMMMDNQDRYFMWFLGILGVVLVFVGILQWRLSSNQIKKITTDAKDQARKEVVAELIQGYGIDKISYSIEKMNTLENSFISYEKKIDSLKNDKNYEERARITTEFIKLRNQKRCTLDFFIVLITHARYIKDNEINLNWFVEKASNEIILKKITKENNKKILELLLSTLERISETIVTEELTEFIEKIQIIYESE